MYTCCRGIHVVVIFKIKNKMNVSTLSAISVTAKTKLRLLYSAMYTYGVYWWFVIKFRLFGPPPRGWVVHSIMAMREPPSTHDDPHDDDFLVIDHTRLNTDGDIVKEVASHVPSHWNGFKVEVRMRHGTKKKRFVARNDESLFWADDVLVKQPMILSAEIHSDRSITDVTKRIRKYIRVPDRRMTPHDYFPIDDHESFEGSKLIIRRMETDGSTVVDDFDF